MDALHFARELIRFDSVSRVSNEAVSDHVAETLHSLHFDTELIAYDDAKGVRKVNVVGRRGPAVAGGLAYFCHTDVVPADDWHDDEHGPFDPVVQHERLYGRGSCDMKGSLATMLAAIATGGDERYQRPLYVVATADEEVGFLGAKQVAQALKPLPRTQSACRARHYRRTDRSRGRPCAQGLMCVSRCESRRGGA